MKAPWRKPPAKGAAAPKSTPEQPPKGRRGRKATLSQQEVLYPPQPTQPEKPVEVVESGSHAQIPLPYQPVSPLEVLAASNPHVARVMIRQLRDMQGIPPDTSDGALKVMENLANGFKHGLDVSSQMEAVAVHLTGRGDRRELQAELADVLDDERTIQMFKSRSKFEDFLHGCLQRSDVTVVEGMAIQGYFNSELDKIFARRSRRSSGDLVSGREPHELVTKSSLPAQLQRKELERKFDEATPQEREILRKLGYKIQTMIGARVTRTTTETVELVQNDDAATSDAS